MKILLLLLAVVVHQAHSQACRDLYGGCSRMRLYCRHSAWVRFMKHYCPNTCGYCGVPTAGPNPNPNPNTQPPQPPVPGQCGNPQVQASRVIAGDNAKQGSWPWQILLMYNGRGMCGGSLVAPNWIVTAAHCIDGKENQAGSFKIRVGEHDRRSQDGNEQDIQVARIFKHPSYSRRVINNDIALLKLASPARLGKYVSPVCLPQHGADVPVGTHCYITGWGKIKHPGNMHYLLQQGRIPVVSQRVCSSLNTKTAGIPITRQMVCAGYGGSSRLSGCHGDSGGPFVCQTGGKWTLHGAVSWGSGSCDSNKSYTVFARVSEFRNWIDSTMRN